MKEGTRILTLKGKNVIEVTEDELRIPVTARGNVTIPPRTGGVFHIDVNATFDTNQVLTPHSPYFTVPRESQNAFRIENYGYGSSFEIKKKLKLRMHSL